MSNLWWWQADSKPMTIRSWDCCSNHCTIKKDIWSYTIYNGWYLSSGSFYLNGAWTFVFQLGGARSHLMTSQTWQLVSLLSIWNATYGTSHMIWLIVSDTHITWLHIVHKKVYLHNSIKFSVHEFENKLKTWMASMKYRKFCKAIICFIHNFINFILN